MMKHSVIALSIWLVAMVGCAARADQYDYILQFPNAAAALADAQGAAQEYSAVDAAWFADHAMIIRAWRNSQNPNGIDVDGNYLAGFYVLISFPRLVARLNTDAATVLVLNRDKCNAGLRGCVVGTTLSGTILQDVRVAPVYSGSLYPFGGLQ